jgi:hypothetical protein
MPGKWWQQLDLTPLQDTVSLFCWSILAQSFTQKETGETLCEGNTKRRFYEFMAYHNLIKMSHFLTSRAMAALSCSMDST